MRVPVRYMLTAIMTIAGPAASAAEGSIGFAGIVPGAPLWPATAAISSFSDRAAIDITLSNPRISAASVRLYPGGGVTLSKNKLRLPPHGLVKVRAFIDLGDDMARPATVCAIIANEGGGGTRACGNYIARRFNID